MQFTTNSKGWQLLSIICCWWEEIGTLTYLPIIAFILPFISSIEFTLSADIVVITHLRADQSGEALGKDYRMFSLVLGT